jgi:hypothetical protein
VRYLSQKRRSWGIFLLTAALASCGARTGPAPAQAAPAQGAPAQGQPTVGEAAKLPEDQQLRIIQGYVDRAVVNLSSPNGLNGKPKSADIFKQQRMLANLTRALFLPDPGPHALPIRGPRVMLARIKKYSAQAPQRTVLDVLGDLVDWSFQHFYTQNEALTADARAKFDADSDAEQEGWFRVFILNDENRRENDKVIAELKAKDAQVLANMNQMYDNAVVLSDGRHVLRADNGDFMVIRANPDDGPDVTLDSDHYAEALAMYNCMRAAGAANGAEARRACAPNAPSAVASPSTQTTPPRPAPTWDDPPDDPFGGDGGIIRPAQPQQ